MQSNAELIERVHGGDEEALGEILQNNIGLIRSIVARFRERGAEYEDLMQIGTIGMIKAVRSFDFSYGTAFSTYAVPLIIGEIRRFLRDDGIIKVSRSIKNCGVHVMKQRELYRRTNGCEPSVGELADICGISVSELVASLEATSPVHSLSEETGEDGLTLENTVSDKENAIEALTDSIALAEALRSLLPLERQIIILRYFKELSQAKTGELLGLTQVKISRKEKKIIKKLREAL